MRQKYFDLHRGDLTSVLATGPAKRFILGREPYLQYLEISFVRRPVTTSIQRLRAS